MLTTAIVILGGLALLALAPDRFVAGSAGLADRWGLSRVLIGAVVIGFGTSSPELLVSGLAAIDGKPEVGVGNIVGSNMANLGLIVAVTGLMGALAVPTGLLRRELPLVVGATVAFALVVQGGLTRLEGILLLAGLIGALTVLVRGAHRSGRPADANRLAVDVDDYLADERTQSTPRIALQTAAGLLGTLAGAQLLVTGALDVTAELDISGGFVGLTVVALGTSLPELVTAVAAARAGEDQLIIGNILGSNLFNCLAVGALVALAGPEPLTDPALTVGAVTAMLAITGLAALAMIRHRTVTRAEAAALLATYLAVMPLLAA
jgi:cation:H+ antiporter